MTGGEFRTDFADVPPGPLLIALSGGADSAALAHAAVDDGRSVRAVFVHHGFPESESMREAAESVAASLEMPLDIVMVTVAGGPSPEDQARRVRLAAIEAHARDGEVIVTGHTADDNSETVLLNIIRGTGITGLAGIPKQRGQWVRPLLSRSRREVRDYALAQGLPFVDDPTNLSAEPTRNRVRLELIPHLRQAYNPQIDAALVRLAIAASDDEVALRPEFEPEAVEDVVRLPIGLVATAPTAVATRALRAAVRRVAPPYPGSSTDIAALQSVVAGHIEQVTIGGGISAVREGPFLVMGAMNPPPPASATPLALDGVTRWGTYEFESRVLDCRPHVMPFGGWRRCVARDALGNEPHIRSVRVGDVIGIGDGHKSVVDALAEAAIPHRVRSNWPVVVSDGKIVWLVGARVAAQASPRVSNQKCVMLSVRRESE